MPLHEGATREGAATARVCGIQIRSARQCVCACVQGRGRGGGAPPAALLEFLARAAIKLDLHGAALGSADAHRVLVHPLVPCSAQRTRQRSSPPWAGVAPLPPSLPCRGRAFDRGHVVVEVTVHVGDSMEGVDVLIRRVRGQRGQHVIHSVLVAKQLLRLLVQSLHGGAGAGSHGGPLRAYAAAHNSGKPGHETTMPRGGCRARKRGGPAGCG
jgi:hypothetical protein